MRFGSVSRTRSAWVSVRNRGISTVMTLPLGRPHRWRSAAAGVARGRPPSLPPPPRAVNVTWCRVEPCRSGPRGERLHRGDRVGLVGASCRRGSAAPGRTAGRRRRGSASSAAAPSKAISTTCSGRTCDHPARRAVDRELGEPLGLPAQHLVGHALERLADHHEPAGVGVAGAEVDVRQRALAPPATPTRRRARRGRGCGVGLTLTQPLPRRPAAYGLSAALTTTPSWPAATRSAKNSLGGARVVGEQPRHARGAGARSTQGVVPRPGRLVDEVDAVAVQHVEEERRERHPLAQAGDVGRAGGAGPGDLERCRPAVVEHDDRLAVEHEVAPGQRARRPRPPRAPAR